MDAEEKVTDISLEYGIMSTDIFSMCRTCMAANKKYYQIFDYVDESQRILEMLHKIVPQIKVKEEDDIEFSNLICEECVDKLVTSYKFQKLSIETYNQLRRLLRDSVEKEFEATSLEEECTEMKIEIFDFEANGEMQNDSKATIGVNKPEIQESNNNQNKDYTSLTITDRNNLSTRKKFSCNKCEKVYDRLSRLEQHTLKHHYANDDNKIEENIDIEISLEEFKNEDGADLDRDDQLLNTSDENKIKIRSSMESETYKEPFCTLCERNFNNFSDLESHRCDPERISEDIYENQEEEYIEDHDGREHAEEGEDEQEMDNNPTSSEEYEHLEGSRASCDSEEQFLNLDAEIPEYKITAEAIETDKPQTGKKPSYPCEVCGKIFNCPSRLKRHSPVHSLDKPYSCEICKRRFSTSHYLKIHKNLHKIRKNRTESIPPEGLQCSDCPKRFKNRNALASHRQVHTRNSAVANFTCDMCQRAFVTVKTLTDHIKNKHPDAKKFTCEECGKSFILRERLLRHLNAHKDLTCHVCEKTFTSEPTLKEHMNIHTGENPYLCSLCGRAFKYHSSLRKHVERHSGISPHHCPECPRSFKCRTDLNKHIKNHLGIKSHICDICGTGFTRSWNLEQHKLLHKGKKRQKCEDCPMTFISTIQFKRHMKTHLDEGISSTT
uniref:Protein krueppel n=1 Tax=Stomoxys calcitrans TaxID=35570 RepID=A0A1I8NV32_STOCA